MGAQLTGLHLIESELLGQLVSRYQGDSGSDWIGRVAYNDLEQRTYVNNDKYFDNVQPKGWSYQISGTLVLH